MIRPPDHILFAKDRKVTWTDLSELSSQRGAGRITRNACQTMIPEQAICSSLPMSRFPPTSPGTTPCPVCAAASTSWRAHHSLCAVDGGVTMAIGWRWPEDGKHTVLPVHQWSQLSSLWSDAVTLWETRADAIRDGTPVAVPEPSDAFRADHACVRLDVALRVERWQLQQRIARTPELRNIEQAVQARIVTSMDMLPKKFADLISEYTYDLIERMGLMPK
jgi:hypothetical protein